MSPVTAQAVLPVILSMIQLRETFADEIEITRGVDVYCVKRLVDWREGSPRLKLGSFHVSCWGWDYGNTIPRRFTCSTYYSRIRFSRIP